MSSAQSDAAAPTGGAASWGAWVQEVPIHQRAMAFGFGAAFVSSFGQSFFIGLFGPAMQATLTMGGAQWGALYGLATLVSGLSMFWLGGLADRLSPTRATGLAFGLVVLGAGLMAGVQTLWMLLAALLCLRLGGQGLAGHVAIVTALRHARQRGRSAAVAAYGFIVGEGALPLLLTSLLVWLHWRWLWLAVALGVLGVAWPVLHRLASTMPLAARAAPVPGAAPVQRRRDLLADRRFVTALAVLMVPPFVITAVFMHQGAVSDLRGWQATWVALAFVGFAVMQATTTWLAGRWVDRRGARSLLVFYLWPLAAGAALMLLPSSVAPKLTLLGLFLGMGATVGAQSVLSGALWAEVFGLERLGMVRGVYTGFMVLATAASPVVLGLVLDAGWPLAAVAGVVMAYALVVPPLAKGYLRRATVTS